MKKSQAFSFDVILAVIIFVGAFFIFYFLLNPGTDKVEELRSCAELVSSALNITDQGAVSESQLQELIDGDYPTLKAKIRAGCDFCIYFEDQGGNIVYVRGGISGVGSSKINISGTPCT
jgi:hypothetical protein